MLKTSTLLILRHTCVCVRSSNCRDPQLTYSETHGCMPTAAIGLPTLLNVQSLQMISSLAFHWLILQHACCVLTAAIGLPKLLNVQSLPMTSSLTCSAKHMCVCSQQQLANPRRSETSLKGQHTCVFQMTSSLTYSAKHVCVLTAAIVVTLK